VGNMLVLDIGINHDPIPNKQIATVEKRILITCALLGQAFSLSLHLHVHSV